MCRLFNDGMAEHVKRSAGRMAGLGVVPPQGTPAVFREADQMEFLSVNDMPQGEFWCENNFFLKGTVSTAHMYGRPKASAEAFTHMSFHWSMYPFALKGLADQVFADGINHFVWHPF